MVLGVGTVLDTNSVNADAIREVNTTPRRATRLKLLCFSQQERAE